MEAKLMEAKMEQMASAARMEVLYEEAINSMRAYNGQEPLKSESND